MMIDIGSGGFCTADADGLDSAVNEVAAPDFFLSTRRAIVRAAAEIGRTISDDKIPYLSRLRNKSL